MKVRNKTSNFLQLPGTAPGWYYNFGPYEEKEVDNQLLGVVTSNPDFEIIPQPGEVIIRKIEISTPEVTVTKEAIIEPTGVTISESSSEAKPEVLQERTIACDICNKVIKSKNEKFDNRILKMHKARAHKVKESK